MAKVLLLGWSTSNHVFSWANALKARGHEIIVITYDGAPIEGIEVVSLPRSSLGKGAYIWNRRRVAALAKNIKPDLIHALFATSYGLWGRAAKRATGVPLIITALGSDIVQSLNSLFERALVKKSLNMADAVTAPSRFLLNQAARFGTPLENKSHLIPWGIDFTRIDAIKPQQVPDSEKVRILFFKHLLKIYAPQLLLSAFVEIAKTFPQATLTMAGKGDLARSLEGFAEVNRIGYRVSFPGFVPHEQSYAFIAGHDIMVMPTAVPEGFGMAALEASALGLPVIASAHGAVSEIVEHERSGLLFKPNDISALVEALSRLLGDTDLRRRYGQAGAKIARKHFDWSKSVDQMSALYTQLLS